MSKRVLCKFFAHGACLKGEHCEYAHDWSVSANNICTFYQRGACAYGSRCRYDHVKASRGQSSGSSSSTSSVGPTISRSTVSSGVTISGMAPVISAQEDMSPSRRQFLPPTVDPWNQQSEDPYTLEDEVVEGTRSDKLADQVICSFAAAGDCPRGEKCPHIHGDMCPTCGKHCLHPFRLKEREEHARSCEKMQNHLEALKCSQEIECSVCLERVLSKPTATERKFGLLSECDHPFCITCIRNWRSSSPTSGMDVNSTLRACPICRKLSYYVIPSVIWYFSLDEKNQIVENYKARLQSIDCKYFDFGNGSCPFGTSCFYKHMVKPDSLLWKRGLNPNMYGHFNSGDEDAVHVIFKSLFGPHKRIKEEVKSVIDEMELLQYLKELDNKFSGDYDREDQPWEMPLMWSQLGCSMSNVDDMLYLQYLEELDRKFTDDDEEEDFLTPWERSFMFPQLGYDMSDDDLSDDDLSGDDSSDDDY